MYVDNLGVFGLMVENFSSTVDDISTQLDAVGLTTHERAVTDWATKTLGVSVDGTHLRTRPDPKRLWTVRRAIECGLGCRGLAGWVWEVVLAHATFLGLVNCNSLSAFCPI